MAFNKIIYFSKKKKYDALDVLYIDWDNCLEGVFHRSCYLTNKRSYSKGHVGEVRKCQGSLPRHLS